MPIPQETGDQNAFLRIITVGDHIVTATSGELTALDSRARRLWKRDRFDGTGPFLFGVRGTEILSGRWLTWVSTHVSGRSARAVDLIDGTLYSADNADPEWFFAELGIDRTRLVTPCLDDRSEWVACDDRGVAVVGRGTVEYKKWVAR